MSSLTMKCARERNYVMLDGNIADDIAKRQAGSLKYIEHLALTTKTNVDDWPVEIFRNKEGIVFRERNKINEIFFTYKAQLPAEAAPAEAAIIPETALFTFNQHITRALTEVRDRYLGQERRAIETLAAKSRHYQVAETELQRVRLAMKALSSLAQRGINSRDLITEVLKDDFWSVSLDESELHFITAPVSVTFFDSVQAAESIAHLGRLRVRILVSDRITCHVKPHSDNIFTRDNYYHPHVKTTGAVCWGSGKTQASAASVSLDLPKYMNLLKQVLTNYNDANPFVAIHEFDRSHAEFEGSDEPPESDETEPEEEAGDGALTNPVPQITYVYTPPGNTANWSYDYAPSPGGITAVTSPSASATLTSFDVNAEYSLQTPLNSDEAQQILNAAHTQEQLRRQREYLESVISRGMPPVTPQETSGIELRPTDEEADLPF